MVFWCHFQQYFSYIMATNFWWWKKPEYSERTTDHGQVTGKLYHLQLRVECTLFCNLQSWARIHAVLMVGLYELLGNPTTYNSLNHTGPWRKRRWHDVCYVRKYITINLTWNIFADYSTKIVISSFIFL